MCEVHRVVCVRGGVGVYCVEENYVVLAGRPSYNKVHVIGAKIKGAK